MAGAAGLQMDLPRDRGSRVIATSIGVNTRGRTCLGLPPSPLCGERTKSGRSGTVIIWHVFMYKKAYAGHKCNARPDLVPTPVLTPAWSRV